MVFDDASDLFGRIVKILVNRFGGKQSVRAGIAFLRLLANLLTHDSSIVPAEAEIGIGCVSPECTKRL